MKIIDIVMNENMATFRHFCGGNLLDKIMCGK